MRGEREREREREREGGGGLNVFRTADGKSLTKRKILHTKLF